MIGNLIAAKCDPGCDITIILHCDREILAYTQGARAMLLSACDAEHPYVELWTARDPGMYATAWQTLCNASAPVLGS